MRTTESKNQNTQLPSQVVAEQSQLNLAISNFFKCYSLEDTEDRIYRMLEEWIFDNGAKLTVSDADNASAFIKCLKGLLSVAFNQNVNAPCSLAAKIEEHKDGWGDDSDYQLLDELLQSWLFTKDVEPRLMDVCNNVAHCRDLVKFTRILAQEGGVSC